jgi:hypothetical protein
MTQRCVGTGFQTPNIEQKLHTQRNSINRNATHTMKPLARNIVTLNGKLQLDSAPILEMNLD